MTQSGLRAVVEERRTNAVIGWTILAFLAASGARELLSGEQVWGALVLALVAVAIVPPVAFRSATAMLPWEVLGLASLPAIGRTLIVGETVGGITFSGRVTTYLAVATVALIVAVELNLFTPVRMTHSFAVFFVTIATMAAAGVWAVVRYFSDTLLGTMQMLNGRPEHAIETALMWDFVAATVAGILAGLLFEYYFRRRNTGAERVDLEVTEA